jgi:hypothetical protein
MQSTTQKMKASKKNSSRSVESTNSVPRICFRVEQDYTRFSLKSNTQNDKCKSINTVFSKLSKLVSKNKTKAVCWEDQKMKCEKCYCVCCKVQQSPPATKKPPPYS